MCIRDSSKKTKKSSIIDKLKSDGAKVYDSESGLKLSELRAVFHEYKDIFERYKDIILDFFGYLRYKIDIPVLRAERYIGLDNPAYTGIASVSYTHLDIQSGRLRLKQSIFRH